MPDSDVPGPVPAGGRPEALRVSNIECPLTLSRGGGCVPRAVSYSPVGAALERSQSVRRSLLGTAEGDESRQHALGGAGSGSRQHALGGAGAPETSRAPDIERTTPAGSSPAVPATWGRQ